MHQDLDALDSTSKQIYLEAAGLLRKAELLGVNLTIELQPLEPLAMGNTAPVIRVWPKRKMATIDTPNPKGLTNEERDYVHNYLLHGAGFPDRVRGLA